jgi:hypothetical protein
MVDPVIRPVPPVYTNCKSDKLYTSMYPPEFNTEKVTPKTEFLTTDCCEDN